MKAFSRLLALSLAFFSFVTTSQVLAVTPLSHHNKAYVGHLFLKWNAKQPGVVTLPSGLQYKIVKIGYGKHPKPNSNVVVEYEGQLINGHVFDSSYQHKKPLVVSLSSVIAGWQEALTLMREGAIWVIYIPSYLAYGARGVPGVICANETLLFKIHLIRAV